MNMMRCTHPRSRENYGTGSLLDSLFHTGWTESESDGTDWQPPTDIREEKERFVIDIDLPGVEKDQIKIVVEENILKITGERKVETSDETDRFTRIERSRGAFQRTFRLPKNIEIGRIESACRNGVLTLEVPKSEEALPRQIEVQVK